MDEHIDKFYNQKTKEKFLDFTSKGTINQFRTLFNSSYKFESAIDKDIFMFNRCECVDLFRYRRSVSLLTVKKDLSLIRKYCEWAYNNKLCERNEEILELREHDFDAVKTIDKKDILISREMLDHYQDMLNNYSDKFILEALFIGLKGDQYFTEIYDAEISGINIKDKTFTTCMGRIIPVTNKFINYAINSNDTYTYQAQHSGGNEYNMVGDKIVKKMVSERVIKRSEGMVNKFQMVSRFTTFKSVFENDLITPKLVIDSGIVHRLKEYNVVNVKEFVDGNYDKYVELAKLYGLRLDERSRRSFIEKFRELL